jgi:hypothetical protein
MRYEAAHCVILLHINLSSLIPAVFMKAFSDTAKHVRIFFQDMIKFALIYGP